MKIISSKILHAFLAVALIFNISAFQPFSVNAATVSSFFVSTSGNDTNEGTETAPFLTLDRAKKAVEDMKKAGGLPKGGVEVVVRQGSYMLSSTFSLDVADSGTKESPVVFKGFAGEKVSITKAKTINSSEFKPVSDQAMLDRIPAEARDKIVYTDLKALGISDYGNIERKIFGQRPQINFDLFVDGQPMTIARWPNTTSTKTGDIIDPGVDESMDPSAKGVVFSFKDDRLKNWATAKDAWLYGFWNYGWGDDSLRVKSIDIEKQTIASMTSPSFGIKTDRRFYIFNLLEELDAPGEYYLDRSVGILYMYTAKSLADVSVMYANSQDPILKLNNLSYVTFENITFEGSCGNGINILGGSNINITNCVIRNVDAVGIGIEGTTNSSITDSLICNIGSDGIIINAGDRTTLAPGNILIKNNEITNFARYNKTYSPAVNLSGVGNIVSHNSIHNAPHVAILLAFNNNIVEYNEIYNVCKEADDSGAIYSGRNWTTRGNIVRNNFIHDIIGVGSQVAGVYLDDMMCGTTINNNIFYKVTMPILVGGGRDNNVENNLIVDQTNNSSWSIMADERGLNDWFGGEYKKNPAASQLTINLNAVPYQSEIWKKAYPELVNILTDDTLEPKRNVIKNNIVNNHSPMNISPTVIKKGTVENNYETKDTLGLADVGKLDFNVPDPTSFSKFSGFKIIPFDEIGLMRDGKHIRTVLAESSETNDLLNSNKPAVLSVNPVDTIVNVGDLLSDKDKWSIPAKFENGEMSFVENLQAYKDKTFKDDTMVFKIKGDNSKDWYAFSIRTSKYDKLIWEGINGYFVAVKNDVIELQRWFGGGNKMLKVVPNAFLNDDKWHKVEFSTLPTDKGILIVLRVDGNVVFNYEDNGENAIVKEGYFTLGNFTSKPLYVSGVSEDEKSKVIDDMKLAAKLAAEAAVASEPSPSATPAPTPTPEITEVESPEQPKVIKNRVSVNGIYLFLDVSPQIENDRLLIPFRAIFEALGAEIEWDKATQTATARVGDNEIILLVNSNEAMVNGEIKIIDAPAKIMDGRILVPVRFVAENLGASVYWDDGARTAVIKTN